MATRHGLDLHRACWLAFGSEGRSEQTIATDQDNGIVFESDDPARDRPAWLRFAHDVNQALDACGYPLCRGNVMASNPECCLSPREWRERFASWIDHGAPQDLLRASIFFDFRPIAGRAELVEPLREAVFGPARTRAAVPAADGRERVAAAAAAQLARRHRDANRRRSRDHRHQAAGHGAVRRRRAHLCAGARLCRDPTPDFACSGSPSRSAHRRTRPKAGSRRSSSCRRCACRRRSNMHRTRRRQRRDANPNLIDVGSLHDIDRRVLKDSLRVARSLRQRLQMDYLR